MAAADGDRCIRNAPYRFHYSVIEVATGALQSGTESDHDAEVSLAGGAFANIAAAEDELDTASGVYFVDLTAAEMTAAGAIVIRVTNGNATATFDVIETLKPEPCLDSGVAQAGGNQTITLRSAAVATLNYYVGAEVEIVRGTGAGQVRTIVHYTTGCVATVDRAWVTNPDNTSVYKVGPGVGSDVSNWAQHGIAQSATATSLRLATTASSTNDLYNGMTVEIVAGTGAGQIRTIVDYVGGTTSATLDHAWTTTPDNTSIYIVRKQLGFQSQVDGVPDVNVEYIDANATAAANLADIAKSQINGSVNDAAATTTSFIGDSGLSTDNDFYNDCYLLFTTGALAGLSRQITDYVGSSRTITLGEAVPSAPANGVEFVIVGNAS